MKQQQIKQAWIHGAVMAAIILTVSCGNKKSPGSEDEKEVATADKSNTTYTVDPATTVVGWKGFKSAGSHHGTIQVKNGTISVDEAKEEITAGNFTIDMKTIKDLDLTNPKENKKLVDDLSSDNLFDVQKFPTSVFEITLAQKMQQP